MSWKPRWFRRPEPPVPMVPPPAVPISFEGVLSEVLDRHEPFNPLAMGLKLAREHVGDATNMGVSGDERDLFHLIDRLSSAVVETYPESLCYAGCGRCCRYPTAFFDIFPEEWALIHRHIDTKWSEERRIAMIDRYWRSHGPRLWVLWAFEWLMGLSWPLFPTYKALPLTCPLLEDERCSVYEARPFPCRAFGHFSAKLTPWSRTHTYACAEQSAQLERVVASHPLNIALPDVSPIQLKQYSFVSGKRRTIASWIARTYPRPWTWRTLGQQAVTTMMTFFNWW